MSEEQGPSAGEPGKPAEDAAAPATVTCPACGAVLKKVTAEPGASVHCLNCGKRFTLEQAGAPPPTPSRGGEGVRGRATAPAKERAWEAPGTFAQPRSAGYWLLRISAVILLVAGLALTPVLLQSMWQEYRRWPRPAWALCQSLYVPLLALGGMMLLFLARALARIDAGATYLAWRSGALREPLPPQEGSSLPYILPVAAIGGAVTVGSIMAAVSLGETDATAAIEGLIGALFGAAVFCIGFALGDLRQFSWRQAQLGRVCFHAAGGQEWARAETSKYCGCLGGGAAWSAALGVLFFIGAELEELPRGRSFNSPEMLIPLVLALGLAGVGYSLYLLGQGWDQTVEWWEMAATQQAAAGNSYKADLLKSSPTRAFCIVPGIWVVCGAIWILLMFARRGGGPRGTAFLGFWCELGAAGAFAVWLSVFLLRVWRWRVAQTHAWMGQESEARQQLTPATLGWWLVWGTVVLAVVQAAVFGWMLFDSFSRYPALPTHVLEVLGFPLLVVMLHYPTIWCALLLREFLELERFYESKRQALSSGEEE